MKIARAEYSRFSIPTTFPLRTARGEIRVRRGFILRLTCTTGIRGEGEASPAYWIGGEQIEDTRRGLEAITDAIGHGAEVEELRAMLSRGRDFGSTAVKDSPAARCALDTALLDLAARERGLAVARLLDDAPTVSLSVAALLAARKPGTIADEAAILVSRGYRCLKLKVGGGQIDDDTARIEAIRQRVGSRTSIRIDANRGWTFEEAVDALGRFEPLAIEFVEEPLARPDPEAMARLRKTTTVPIALDESLTDEAALDCYLERSAVDVVVLKAARIGGLSESYRLGRRALSAGLKVIVTDSIETRVGMAAAVHLAAALGPDPMAMGLGGARFLPEVSREASGFPASPRVEATGPGLDVSPS